jgi:hypothetical protein
VLGTVGRGRCGNRDQNREEGVVLYDERAGMSGHFFLIGAGMRSGGL